MRTRKLSVPSDDLRKRILSEINFEDRLEGFSLRERSGPMPVTVYSFDEVVSLLADPHPRLDFRELEGWIRRVMGDTELAEKIAGAIQKGSNDRERTCLIRELMEERLNQCHPEEYDEDHIG
jgi:hypothetical protein